MSGEIARILAFVLTISPRSISHPQRAVTRRMPLPRRKLSRPPRLILPPMALCRDTDPASEQRREQEVSSIVILTGAGISKESGLDTFRDPDGIWARHRLEDVATPEAFARNPALVHDFYNARRRVL